MSEIVIEKAPEEYRRYLTIGDAKGNFNQKVDSKEEAQIAAEEFCKTKTEECQKFLGYLEKSGIPLPPIFKKSLSISSELEKILRPEIPLKEKAEIIRSLFSTLTKTGEDGYTYKASHEFTILEIASQLKIIASLASFLKALMSELCSSVEIMGALITKQETAYKGKGKFSIEEERALEKLKERWEIAEEVRGLLSILWNEMDAKTIKQSETNLDYIIIPSPVTITKPTRVPGKIPHSYKYIAIIEFSKIPKKAEKVQAFIGNGWPQGRGIIRNKKIRLDVYLDAGKKKDYVWLIFLDKEGNPVGDTVGCLIKGQKCK